MKKLGLVCFLAFNFFASRIISQEMVVPLQQNVSLLGMHDTKAKPKHRSVGLPFIDDFSYEGPFPNSNLWVEKQAYINNTMGFYPINRGVATLDGLDQYGRPYLDTQTGIRTSDSLTSVEIDLSSYTSANNIFLSFFAQPEGLGFAPETNDSLFVYFKNNSNQWLKMWQIRGTGLTAFKMYFIPVLDAQFLHAGFQFRFVNLASPNINDDVWNIDYVKMDVNRSLTDSIANDIGFTTEPTPILAPFTELPYRHFILNQTGLKTPRQFINLYNLYPTAHNLTVTHEAKEIISGTALFNATNTSINAGAKSLRTDSFQTYNISYTPPSPNAKVVVEDKYYFNSVNAADRKINDTIRRLTVFENYFAYDDGSAEKSYFLLNAFNTPAKTALQFHLNQADTLRGLSVHFGAQAPSGAGKYFSIVLYKKLGSASLNDSIIHQEDLFQVVYDTLYNGFSNYQFNTAPVLDSGTYYIGITQPANFGSDSIYFGLDVNTKANKDFLFYNVTGTWEGSNIVNASIMMRPIVGPSFIPTQINTFSPQSSSIQVYPNPCLNQLKIKGNYAKVELFTLGGKRMKTSNNQHGLLDISEMPNQFYIVKVTDLFGQAKSFKILKQ